MKEIAVIGGREVALTNQDKIIFPAIGATKGDLVRHYVEVAPYALNHVARRPMQMKRYPNGVDADFFYQKRAPSPRPEWLRTVHIKYPSGNSADFAVIDDAAGLAWLANLACIELHTWHSRVDDLERPDYLLIDIDPREGDPWSAVRDTALATRDILAELRLPGFPKTSGATGLHVLVPIVVDLEYPEVKRFAKKVAQLIAARVPSIATTTWKVKDREGVFVDYGQNARDRTIASAYSVRPVADARVSAPLRWDEVAAVDPGDLTIRTMRSRLAAVGDLTADIWSAPVALRGRFGDIGLKEPKG